MHLSRITKKLFQAMIAWPFYIFGLLIPRSKDIWVFGAWFGNRYADSPRYVFEFVTEQLPGIRAVWLSRNKKLIRSLRAAGRPAYGINSLMGFWHCARAGAVFVNTGYADVNRYALKGAVRIQFWHGIPLKKIHYDDEKNLFVTSSPVLKILQQLSLRLFPFLKEEWDLIISTSPAMTGRLLTAFHTTREKISETGSPRTDVILKPTYTREQVLQGVTEGKKIILYAPTHRNLGSGRVDLFSGFPHSAAAEVLQKTDAVFLIKMHYYHEENHSLPGVIQSAAGRVQLLTSDSALDINLILPFVDILITDYSSVYFDFLVLNRPIIFAPFDLKQYLKDDRELYEAYESATPGPKCADWESVFRVIEEYAKGEDLFERERRLARERWYSHLDTDACKRVVGRTQKLLGFLFADGEN